MATAPNTNPYDIQQSGSTPGGLVSGSMTQAAQFNPQQRSLNRETETASGQLNTILSKDGPLMQRARATAMQGMNARGLVNSSMAQGAGVAEMIDRATPLAQQDAQAFNNQALANQKYVNEGGMFNAGEQNKFGLQKGDQAFTASENAAGRQFTTSERLGGQTFTSGQNLATQNFQAAQSQLDRALQASLTDKSLEATRTLEQARQTFQGAQNSLDRTNQKTLQEGQQTFQGAQNSLDRTNQKTLQEGQQTFQGAQNALDRTNQKTLQEGQQTFQSTQNSLDRTQQTTLQTLQQTFTAAQSALDRALQTSLTDKSIAAQSTLASAQQAFQSAQNALDRTQQTTLQNDQQTFTQAQAGLDRAQQDKTTAANQAFQSTQNQLDRDQQEDMIKLQSSLNSANVSGTFAANIVGSTSTAINEILNNPDIRADAKTGAIDNVIKGANATLQWGATFYNTPLPSLQGPNSQTGTGPTLTPGGPVAAPVTSLGINPATGRPWGQP